TYRCNLQCSICWKREYGEPLKPDEELSDARLLEIVEEGAELGVREWIVGGGGELMLRNEAVRGLCRRIRGHGMDGLIQTNGTRFTDEDLEALVDVQWGMVNVSLDGPNAGINDAIRTEDCFRRATETIRRLQRLKRERGVERPLINIVSVITNRNYGQLKGMVDLSEELGLSPGCISAVDLIVYGEHDKAFELNTGQRNELRPLVREAIAYADKKGVVHNYRTYLAALGDSGALAAMDLFSGPEERVSSRTMCFEPFLHLLILPSGLAGPCCTYYEPNSDSVAHTPLAEVWLGPYLEKVRGQILGGRPPKYCAECMITKIQENRNMQAHLAQLERRLRLAAPLTLGEMAAKVRGSLQRRGVRGTIQRGREWLQLRSAAKKPGGGER
ncbi:MAG: radical SAM protein, partial [Candidatus Hydrogenedentes bacterium]|nr:radical SAM protein [Candidatus Hydrogenedentota bacterium]